MIKIVLKWFFFSIMKKIIYDDSSRYTFSGTVDHRSIIMFLSQMKTEKFMFVRYPYGHYLATLFSSCKVWQLQRWENDYKTVSVVLSKNLLDWKPAKGQIEPKADWSAVDSPKKQTNEVVLLPFLFFTANKPNLFVCFFGSIYDTPKLLLVLSDL